MAKLVSPSGKCYAVSVENVGGIQWPVGWIMEKCYRCDTVVAVDPQDLADPETLLGRRICTKCTLDIALKLKGGETVEDY